MTRKSFLAVIGGSLVAVFSNKAKSAQPVTTIMAATPPGRIPHDILYIRDSGSTLFKLMCQMEEGKEWESSYNWFGK